MEEYEEMLKDKTTPVLKKRLIASLVLLIPLMYVSMGHMMWNWPLPHFFDGNHVAMGLVQLLFTTVTMVINQKFFISGFKSLLHRCSEHGYPGGTRFDRILRIQRCMRSLQ